MVSIELDMIQTAGIGALALVVGMVLTRKIAFLQKFCVPSPVSGGIIFLLVTLHIPSGHISCDACQPCFKALWIAQLVHLGKGQQKCIMCQFLCHLSIAYDALAYPRHLPVICLIQASKCILVALSPTFYEFFYVHRKHTASTDIDTIFSKRLHGNHNFFHLFLFILQNRVQRYRLSQIFRTCILHLR